MTVGGELLNAGRSAKRLHHGQWTVRQERRRRARLWRRHKRFNMTHIALRAQRAEASQVVRAGGAAHMLLGTLGTKFTKATLIAFAPAALDTRLNVHVQAVFRRVAESKSGEKAALRHAPQVVLVQVVAHVALLAQSSQPVLADRAP